MKKSILKIMSIAAIFSLAYLNFSLDIQANSGDLKLEQLKASAECETFNEYDPYTQSYYLMTCCDLLGAYCYDDYDNILNLKLDREISSFDVSFESKTIYAISKNERTFMPEIVEFKFN